MLSNATGVSLRDKSLVPRATPLALFEVALQLTGSRRVEGGRTPPVDATGRP